MGRILNTLGAGLDTLPTRRPPLPSRRLGNRFGMYDLPPPACILRELRSPFHVA
jgi:hypothetical protein